MTIGKKIKLNITQAYISRLENEKFQPTAPVICSLAKALKCTADYLISDERKAG